VVCHLSTFGEARSAGVVSWPEPCRQLSDCCRAIPPQPGDSRRPFSDVFMVRSYVQTKHRSFCCHRDAPPDVPASTFCSFGGLPDSFQHTVLSSSKWQATSAPLQGSLDGSAGRWKPWFAGGRRSSEGFVVVDLAHAFVAAVRQACLASDCL